MRALFVTAVDPLPAESGARQRVWNSLLALSQVADLDVFLVNGVRPDAAEQLRAALGARRVIAVGAARRPRTAANVLRWLTLERLPSSLWMEDASRASRELARWATPPYDVVWTAGPLASVVVTDAGAAMGPLVVDRYDIEEELLRQQLRVEGHWRRPYRLANDLLNIARWRRYNRGRARAADRVVVCSREDAKRAQSTTAVVIPNGYGSPDVAPAARDVRTPPTFLFQGRMTYDPNVDAASFFARRVLPRLQPRLPGAQLRIVGHCDERVWALDELPDVTVVGFVPTMDEELARADVVVVPIRFGSGTRIKALEAFAHRIPVVSTRRGVEGLDVEDGVHVLIADAPSEFVDACTRVATDGALRAGITARAHDLYTEHYTWAAIRATIGELAAEVASAT